MNPKGKALISKVYRESQARMGAQPYWKAARLRSAKGKTGYTRSEIREVTRSGEIGRYESVRFIP